jgi:beta-phosphoglucomutase-like phosphatase (HAD superfamily)
MNKIFISTEIQTTIKEQLPAIEGTINFITDLRQNGAIGMVSVFATEEEAIKAVGDKFTVLHLEPINEAA